MDGKLDYYLPDVLTSNDYYPGGMPMPGRTFEGSACSTVSTPTTNYVLNEPFASGTGSYTGINGATLSNTGAGGTPPLALLVTKLSTATGVWATRSIGMTLTAGRTYDLSFAITLNTCSAGKVSNGWRLVDASSNVIASGTILASGTITGSFNITATGTYYLEIYRNTTTTGACGFAVDDVKLWYTTYVNTTTCGTPGTGDIYPWGHNGQFKDNELYGNDMAYTAEYWEYDSRLLRRWNTDPIEYEWQSPYACFNNNPIYYADPLGLEGINDGGGGGDKKNKDGGIPLPSTRQEATTTEVTDDSWGSTGMGWRVTAPRTKTNDAVVSTPSKPQDKPKAAAPKHKDGEIFIGSDGQTYVYFDERPGDYQTKGIDFALFKETVQRDHLPMLQASSVLLEFSGGLLLPAGEINQGINYSRSIFTKEGFKFFWKNAKEIFKRLGKGTTLVEETAEGGSQLLLGPGAANLTQPGLEHIVARHWFTSGAKSAGKFLEGTTATELKEMITITTTRGVFRPNTMGRTGTIAEYNFGYVIGTTSKGLPASNLRVVIGTNGNVISAFPF